MQLIEAIKAKGRFFLIFWLSAWILIFLTFLTILNPLNALRNSLGFVLPLILPVLLLDHWFERFFLDRRYWLYIIFSVTTLALFGLANFLIFKLVVRNPEAESNTLLSILLFFFLYRGVQYFRSGMVQQMKLNEALAHQMKLELALRETEARQFKAELGLLKAQINPHFLFNTLNNIYSLVVTQHENAPDALLRLSSVMRYVLDAAKSDQVRLSDEIRFIENLVSLEEIRLEDQCDIEFTEETCFPDRNVAPLLFIPLVENCFKHGIGPDKLKNRVVIRLFCNEQAIVFSTINNVMVDSADSLEKKDGNGLANLRKRLGIIYPGKASLETGVAGQEYHAKLTISEEA
jgi:LytS/YehU family sensor histidine kinase